MSNTTNGVRYVPYCKEYDAPGYLQGSMYRRHVDPTKEKNNGPMAIIVVTVCITALLAIIMSAWVRGNLLLWVENHYMFLLGLSLPFAMLFLAICVLIVMLGNPFFQGLMLYSVISGALGFQSEPTPYYNVLPGYGFYNWY